MNQEEDELFDKDENQGFVLVANEILRKCKIQGEVESLEQCSDSYFIAVYEGILGEPLKGVIPFAVSREDKIRNCEIVIDALSCEVLNVDLSHITGDDIVAGDLNSIQNLLEIFKDLLDFILDVDEYPDLNDGDEQNDSNLLSSDHEVISGVLREELGSSYEALTTENRENQKLRKPIEAWTSDGSCVVGDISSIPKWDRGGGSSRSSACDGNSTDEIIRESELFEQKLAREYPSLHVLREKNRDLNSKGSDKHQKSEASTITRTNKTSLDTRGTAGTTQPSTTNELGAAQDGKRSAVQIKEIGAQTNKPCENFDERLSDKSSETEDQSARIRDIRGSQVKIRDSRNLEGARSSNTLKPNKEMSAVKDASGPTDNASYGDIRELREYKEPRAEAETGSHFDFESSAIPAGSKPANNKRHQVRSERPLNSKLLNKASGSSKKTREEGGTLRTSRTHETRDDSRVDCDVVPVEKLKSTDETLRHKLQTRALGVPGMGEEQRGSRLTHWENADHQNGTSSRVNKKNGHEDESDTSGVLWDDQISPLDASEELRGVGTGLAFEDVGLGSKRSDKENRGYTKPEHSQERRVRGSPVVRHYHHHFHHPHGSSDDLVRDLEPSTKTETTEEHGSRSLLNRSIQDGEPTMVPYMRSSTTGRRNIREKSVGGGKGVITSKDKLQEKRSVKFDDNVEMMLITNRLERLKKEMERDEKEQKDRTFLMRSSYGGHLQHLNQEREKMEKDLKKLSKTATRIHKPSPRRMKRRDSSTSRDRAQAVYGKPSCNRKARYPSSKAKKRSTSCSPKIQQRKKTAKQQLEKGEELLPAMLDEFPFLHLSPHTMQMMRKKQNEQLMSLAKSAAEERKTKTQKVIEDAEKRQQTLLKILRKDLLHNQRMREEKERKEQERAIKSKLREKRHASARARRYYEDYQLRMRARLLKRRTREEQIFKNIFQDGLAIQKQRVQELRNYAKEQREMRAVRQQNELESLENYYRDQYSILADAIAYEKESLQIREKAQEKVIQQMQRNLRQKLQKEVTEIQETLVRDEDDAYFRRLDAERLRRQMQLASFQNLS